MRDLDTIGRRFRHCVAVYPDAIALIAGETQYTYASLASMTSEYAGIFRDRLHLEHGQLLLAYLDNSVEFVASFLAAAEIGAIFVPLNINWKSPELSWFVERLPVTGVVTRQALRLPWDSLSDQVPPASVLSIDDDRSDSTRFHPLSREGCSCDVFSTVTPDQPVVYLCTSGSTGAPKIVRRTHENMVQGALSTGMALSITPGLGFLSMVPFFHGNGLDNALLLPLLSGGTAILQSSFSIPQLVNTFNEHQIDVLPGSPAIFEMIERFGINRDCFNTVRVCTSAGGPIAEPVVASIQERFGITIRQAYGASETGIMAIAPPEGGSRLVPVHGTSIRILDSSRRVLSGGIEGEIAVNGPIVSDGYIGNSEATSRVFADGYYCTGDKGILDTEGRLRIIGRISPLINISGTKIDPVEVENVIISMPDVVTCKVFAQNGTHHKQILKAAIGVRDGTALSRVEVVAFCRKHLAEYKIPRIMEIFPDRQVDLTGKTSFPWQPLDD